MDYRSCVNLPTLWIHWKATCSGQPLEPKTEVNPSPRTHPLIYNLILYRKTSSLWRLSPLIRFAFLPNIFRLAKMSTFLRTRSKTLLDPVNCCSKISNIVSIDVRCSYYYRVFVTSPYLRKVKDRIIFVYRYRRSKVVYFRFSTTTGRQS